MARKEKSEWKDHLVLVLSTKPAEVVQKACQVLEQHGYPVKKKLKSGLYYSSTLCLSLSFNVNITRRMHSIVGRA